MLATGVQPAVLKPARPRNRVRRFIRTCLLGILTALAACTVGLWGLSRTLFLEYFDCERHLGLLFNNANPGFVVWPLPSSGRWCPTMQFSDGELWICQDIMIFVGPPKPRSVERFGVRGIQLTRYTFDACYETSPLWELRTPLAVPFGLFFAYPGFVIVRRLVRRRSRPSEPACEACGYCLIGNESGICPECGTAIHP